MTETKDPRVTVLRDNLAPEGLRAGHGLALLVEVGDACLLLDTGDSPETWENADALGVDLGRVQCLVLSHGHYDHTGGIEELLRRTGGLRVVAHPAAFEPRWASDGTLRYIGQPLSRQELEALGAAIELSAEPVEIAPGVMTTGQVPRDVQPMPHQTRLRVEREGRIRPDDFADDMSVVVRRERAAVLLTGCAHAGLINIVAHCERLADAPVRALIGGTHLMHTPEAGVSEQADELTARGVRHIAPLHCTGESGRRHLMAHFAGTVLLAGTGDTIVAEADGALRLRAGATQDRPQRRRVR